MEPKQIEKVPKTQELAKKSSMERILELNRMTLDSITFLKRELYESRQKQEGDLVKEGVIEKLIEKYYSQWLAHRIKNIQQEGGTPFKFLKTQLIEEERNPNILKKAEETMEEYYEAWLRKLIFRIGIRSCAKALDVEREQNKGYPVMLGVIEKLSEEFSKKD